MNRLLSALSRHVFKTLLEAARSVVPVSAPPVQLMTLFPRCIHRGESVPVRLLVNLTRFGRLTGQITT